MTVAEETCHHMDPDLMKPTVDRSSLQLTISPALRAKRWLSVTGTSCFAWLLAVTLSACGDISSTSGLASSERALHGSADTAEASAQAAMPTSSEGTSTEAGQPIAAVNPGAEAPGLRDAGLAKNTPPPRVDRQAGEISDPSPSGFRLGGITVVIDGSTRIEPVTALAEGEPVDVTGHFESDRRTLRATVVRSTRPATDTPAATEATPGQSS